MFYKEFVYTLRNWRVIALSAAFTGVLAGVTLAAPEAERSPSFLFLALYFLSIQGFATGQRRLVEDFTTGTGVMYLRSPEPVWKFIVAKWSFELVVPFLLLGVVTLEISLLDGSWLDPSQLLFLAVCFAAFPGLVLVTAIAANPPTFNVVAPFFLLIPATVVLQTVPGDAAIRVMHFVPMLNGALGMRQIAFGEPLSTTLAVSLAVQLMLCLAYVSLRYRAVAFDRI